MEFRLLGPVQLRVGGRALDLGPPKQRMVLAALLLDAGRPVRTETIVDRVWDDAPPAEARNALYGHVMRIRRILAHASASAHRPRLDRASGGYTLQVDPDLVDWHRFRRLVEQARNPAAEESRRAVLLREALTLWRGTPLADLSGSWVAGIREGCRRLYLDAVVAWAEVELRLGNHQPVITRVQELAADHPLVEPLAGAQMRALYAAGRAAEALTWYAAFRNRLADELGTDPGPELQRLYRGILRGDLEPPRPPAGLPASPAQLPADLAGFSGRGYELSQLDAALDRKPGVGAVVVSGTAGVGKTTLAIHWAHRVRERFPDGQLYVNLRGFDPGGEPMTPTEAIRGMLDALGVPAGRVPIDAEAQAGLYRSRLADRRMLVVLDNARDPDQVRPLLPGTPGNLVLVTSRNQLSGLIAMDAAYPLTLDLPSAAEARDLLAGRLGLARVAAEPDAVDEIVSRSARLPLALALVAARAATHPRFSLATFADELRETHQRLEALANPDAIVDIRSVFDWSYRQLSSGAARLFRLLGLHPGPDIAARAATSLAGLPLPTVRPLLAELCEVSLVSEHSPGRYTLHDLLRAYAAELGRAEDPESDRRAATQRVLDHYLHTAHAADRLLDPHRDTRRLAPPSTGVTPELLTTYQQALTWFDTEHFVLLRIIDWGSDHRFEAHTWQLAWAASKFLDMRGHWPDYVVVAHRALDASRRLADEPAQAIVLRVLAKAYVRLRRYDAAERHLQHALDLTVRLDDQRAQAHTHSTFMLMYGQRDKPGDALRHARFALDLYRSAGDQDGVVTHLNNVGWYYALVGDHRRALTYCQQALQRHVELNDRIGQAHAWDSLGYAHHHLGDLARAASCYGRARELFRELVDRASEAATLIRLGDTHVATGQPDEARRVWRQALAILDELEHPDAADARTRLDRLPEAVSGS